MLEFRDEQPYANGSTLLKSQTRLIVVDGKNVGVAYELSDCPQVFRVNILSGPGGKIEGQGPTRTAAVLDALNHTRDRVRREADWLAVLTTGVNAGLEMDASDSRTLDPTENPFF